MAFDLEVGGHHAGYLQNLVRVWGARNRAGALCLALSPALIGSHPELVADARNADVTVVPTQIHPPSSSALLRWLPAEVRLAERAMREWRALCRVATEQRAAHVMALYVDGLLQTPLALGMRAPCRVSGLYFRPTFHYGSFEGHSPDLKERLRALRQKIIVARALAHPALDTLFCLDAYAVDYMTAHFRHGHRTRHLADPVHVHPESSEVVTALRSELGIPDGMLVLLLFGMITPRKGLLEVLAAVRLLSAEEAGRICLLVVGPHAADFRETAAASVQATRQATRATIVIHERFVPDAENQRWFGLADIVLAPYQRHVGMSAILVRAAAAEKPVLADQFGLLGEVTRRRHLGVTVDAGNPEAIARGLRDLMTVRGAAVDRESQRALTLENSATAFADAIFEKIAPQ